jgi:hypothetical protein
MIRPLVNARHSPGTGDEPAEILSIFERPGERMTAGTSVP